MALEPPSSNTPVIEGSKPKSVSKRLIKIMLGAAGITKNKPKPLYEENSLSVIERYFHQIPIDREQVYM